MTQSMQIRKHLESGKTLTPLDALNLFGCFRLAARISELREEGWNISAKMEKNENTGKIYARYQWEKEQMNSV